MKQEDKPGLTPEEPDAIIELVKMKLDDLQATESPDRAVEICRSIYAVGRAKLNEAELLHAMSSRLPVPTAKRSAATAASTNGNKLIITFPLGEIHEHVIYAAPTPDGSVYIGKVRYTNSALENRIIADWDNAPATDRRAPTGAYNPAKCKHCGHRTQTPDKSGRYRCTLTRHTVMANCCDVPETVCSKSGDEKSIYRTTKSNPDEPANITAVIQNTRGLSGQHVHISNHFFPYLRDVLAAKGFDLARTEALTIAKLQDVGWTYRGIATIRKDDLLAQVPKTVTRMVYAKMNFTINTIKAYAERHPETIQPPQEVAA